MQGRASCWPSLRTLPIASHRAGAVVFHDDAWPYDTSANGFENVTVTFEHRTEPLGASSPGPPIVDADIEINGTKIPALLAETDGGAVDPASSPGMQRLFLHAAGHFLAFAHSPDPEWIMYANFSPGDNTLPALIADDAAGMCAAYPSNGERPNFDSRGRAVTVPASACALGAEVAPSTCSSSSLRLDHGCSLGRRSSHEDGGALLGAGLVGLLSVRARRRRRP